MQSGDEVNFQQSTPLPPQDNSQIFKGILYIILAFVLLFGGAVAGYWYGAQQAPQRSTTTSKAASPPTARSATPEPIPLPTPTTPTDEVDETAGWKVFTNDEYAYKVEYPKEWLLEENPLVAPHSELLSSTVISHPQNPTVHLVIAVRDIGFNDYLTAMRAYATEPIRDVVVGGVEGKRVIQEESDRGGHYVIGTYLPYNNKTYDISAYMSSNIEDKNKYISVFDQILSTFKFID